MKEILGTIAVILAFGAYIPYIRDILKGKTKTHVYSWFVWGLIGFIIFALQLSGGAGPGAYVTLSASIISMIVFLLGLRNGTKDITLTDTIFFISALVATGIWVFAERPILSVILLCIVAIFGFFPTVRKSWNKPHEETSFTWNLNAFRYGLSILALSHYNILTLLYPATWFIANVAFSLMILIRHKQLSSK